jgi:hypothetical protein
MNFYDDEEETYDLNERIAAYEQIQDDNGFNSEWSIFDICPEKLKNPCNITELHYEDNSVSIKAGGNGIDLWRAADQLIQKSSYHGKYIEGFFWKEGKVYVSVGS